MVEVASGASPRRVMLISKADSRFWSFALLSQGLINLCWYPQLPGMPCYQATAQVHWTSNACIDVHARVSRTCVAGV